MDENKILPIEQIQPAVHLVNYFTLKTGRDTWGPRTIPDFEMILIRRGSFTYREESFSPESLTTDKRQEGLLEIELKPGDLLLIPPGVEHTFSSLSDSVAAISCIHFDPFPDSPAIAVPPGLSSPPEYKTDLSQSLELMEQLFHRANDLFESYHPYREELLNTVCREIWLRMAASWKGRPKEEQISERMLSMLDYIKKNCCGDIGRRELSREFNITPEHINSLFKKELNMTPSTCINRERVLLACSRIYNEGLSIKEAAFQCGFKDPYYFSKIFKKVLGISPSDMKQMSGFFQKEKR